MPTETRIVTDRMFLLGLDSLYREAMKDHERAELLECARAVAAALKIGAASGEVQGYYAEEPELTEYFRLLRALQEVEGSRRMELERLPSFRRLHEVVTAPIFGPPVDGDRLLPMGGDPLYKALEETRPHWTISNLVAAAARIARNTDDMSLVGLAARAEDPVVLAALRESVVLYAERSIFSKAPARVLFEWRVSKELAQAAGRFIESFNALLGEDLPSPTADHAAEYWKAYDVNKILGRCARLGNDLGTPQRHYHWAIRWDGDGLAVEEFWDVAVWGTARYRAARRR